MKDPNVRKVTTDPAVPLLGPGERRRLLSLLFGMNLINYVDRVNITIVAPVILAELGWDKATLGGVMSVTLLGYAAGQIPAGLLIDRFGGFVILGAMCFAWSLATALTPPLFGWFGALLAIRFLLGLFESVNNPGQTALNTRAFPPDQLARAQGFCFAGTQLGPLLASPLIAWLVTLYPWPYIFYGCAVLGFVWVAAWIAFAPRLPDRPPDVEDGTASPPSGSDRWRIVLARPVLALALTGLMWGYSMWLFVAWFPTYLSDAWGFSMQELGWINTIPTFGGMAALLAGGWISDHLVRRGVAEGRARKLLAVTGLAGSAVCIAAAGWAPSAVLAIAFFTLNGMVQGLAVAPIFSLPAVLAPKASATIAATTNFCMALGGVISPYLAGVLRDRSGGWETPFLSAAMALVAAALVLGLAFRAEPLEGGRRVPSRAP
jgi:MFS transporter, ACS family, D-galactonate transporter